MVLVSKAPPARLPPTTAIAPHKKTHVAVAPGKVALPKVLHGEGSSRCQDKVVSRPRSIHCRRCISLPLVEHSYINPKSPTFGYLDKKPIYTGFIKFLGLCPFALSWVLEFASAFSISSAPFTTNVLPP
ncbi:hypothetical protein GW17_00030094 [Ensete ventricosum]|nr:hypothetical protein GW17_00030094 [Ensete ventricosum]